MKAVVFDLNGVLIQSPKLSDRFKYRFDVSEEEFLPALGEIMNRARIPGSDSIYSYWEPYLKKWNVELSEKEFLGFWFNAEKENTEMTELLNELKNKEIKLFVLSNNFVERANYYKENFPFLEKLFDKIYYSWQTGFIKPDKRAYQLIFDENNLKPEDCLYFDDSKKNIDFAINMGISSFLFQSADETRKIIERTFG